MAETVQDGPADASGGSVLTNPDGGGSGGGSTEELLALYGNGSNGDHTTSGDETWDSVSGAPGNPTVPFGSDLPFAFFNNLTISPGDSVAIGSLVNVEGGGNAIVIFVRDTLTIGEGARIHVNGGDGLGGGLPNPFGSPGGPGRKAIINSTDGASGGQGTGPLAGNTPGGSGTDRPAILSSTHVGGAGGSAGILPNPGALGGSDQSPASWPYSLSQAISIASLLYTVGGGNGGGGGASANSSAGGGGGGGGAGTLVIFARNIIAPPGSLQAIGGNGGPGSETELQGGAGGGGGTGGFVLIVTDNLSVAGLSDVSGGVGGFPVGFPANPGNPGGPGEAVAFNPMLGSI